MAVQDLKHPPSQDASKIVARVEALEDDSKGAVTRVTIFMPDYRLRVGHSRALVEVEGPWMIGYRIQQRTEVDR